MAKILYNDGNNQDIVISPVRRRSDGTIETGVVFSCTLYDQSSNPVAGATGLLTAFEAATQCNVVTIPGSVTAALPAGSGYLLQVQATGSFASMITFTNVPIVVRSRSS